MSKRWGTSDGRGRSSCTNALKTGLGTACVGSAKVYLRELDRTLTVLELQQAPGAVPAPDPAPIPNQADRARLHWRVPVRRTAPARPETV